MAVERKRPLERLSLFLHSIRFRLVAWFVLILGVVVVGFAAFIYIRQVQELRSIALSRLAYKSQRLMGLFRFVERSPFPFDPAMAPPDYGEPLLQQSDVLAVFANDGSIVQSWGPIAADEINKLVEIPKVTGGGGIIFDAKVADDTAHPSKRNEYIFENVAIVRENQVLGYLFVGSPVDPNSQLPRLLASLIFGVLLTLTAALAGGFWLADRAMRPVKAITQAARTISETDLNRRLRLGGKDELGQLADTFDAMLARLQAAFERQRQFTADASHELRTPLTVVELETSRALEGRRSAQEYEQALKIVHSENEYMSRMVNNLLTLARMDAGQIVMHKEALDLSDVTLEVIERLAPLAVNEQVTLTAGELPELPIQGDRQYLVQMLINLVENAIKYAGSDKPVLVEAGLTTGEGQNLAWVRVTDHGPGISAEHLPHIFDRYYRVDKARARQSGDGDGESGRSPERAPSGTGLGLSIAQWIARAHGGEINVSSVIGQGSTFEVDLPMNELPE